MAYEKFLHELNQWWPKEYTWSQEDLQDIRIDPRVGGFCTEIGPGGFRCDWGKVTSLSDQEIGLKWQISANREPIPNPEKASDLSIRFMSDDGATLLQFEHDHFDNHGEGWEKYQEMMDSEYGWDYILDRFKHYCEK